MTPPKDNEVIITNNTNNAVINEQETYKLEDFKKWLEEDKSRKKNRCWKVDLEMWSKENGGWMSDVDRAFSFRKSGIIWAVISTWKKEVDEKNQATNSNQITQTTKPNNTDQDLIKKSQEVAKISTELDQVLNKYQPEEIKPLNLTERYEKEQEKINSDLKKMKIKEFSIDDPLNAFVIREVGEKEGKIKTNWFGISRVTFEDGLEEKVEQRRFELQQAIKNPQAAKNALKHIENENLEIVKKERSELIGAMTLAKRNYEDLIQATSDALKLKSKKVEDLTKDNENIIEQGSKELEKAKREKEAIIKKLKFDKEKEKNDLDNAISQKVNELNKVSKEKKALENEKSTTLAKLGELDQAKANLTIKLNSRTSDLDQANQDKTRLEREKRALQSQINTLNDEKQVLIDNYNEVSRDKNELVRIRREEMRRILENNTLPETKDLNINDLNFENNELKKLVIKQRANITSDAVTLRELEREKTTAQNTLISMNDEKERLEQELRGVEAKLDNIKIDLNRAEQNMIDKDEEIERLKAKIERLEAEISELAETKQQLSHIKIDLETANSELERLKGEIDKLKKEVADREIYIQSLDGKNSELVKENLELFNECNGLNTNIKDLERQLETNAEYTLNWENRTKAAESKEQDLKNKIFSEEKKTSDLEADKSSLEQKIKDLEQEIQQLTAEISTLKREISEVKNFNSQLDSKLKSSEEVVANLKSEITTKNNQITTLKSDLNEIKNEINKHFWFNSKTAKDGVRRLIDKNRDLKRYEPSFVHKVGDWTGINWLTGKIGSTFTVLGFAAVVPVLFKAYLAWQSSGISLMGKRKKNCDNDDYEEEPQPRRTKRVKPEPVINEVEVIKSSPVIEAETVKQLPEEVMDIRPATEEKKKTNSG